MFSSAAEYAIKACIWIATQSTKGKLVTINEIVDNTQLQRAFTAKVLQTLASEKVIGSVKGRHGGFFIPENAPERISLFDIVQAIDGNKLLHECVLGLKICSDVKPCPAHFKYVEIKKRLTDFLLNTSLLDLTKGVDDKEFFLNF